MKLTRANPKAIKYACLHFHYAKAVRRYIDPNATVFKTQGKRKYLFPMTKQMRKQLEPLAKPYPKKTELCDNEDVCVGSET